MSINYNPKVIFIYFVVNRAIIFLQIFRLHLTPSYHSKFMVSWNTRKKSLKNLTMIFIRIAIDARIAMDPRITMEARIARIARV